MIRNVLLVEDDDGKCARIRDVVDSLVEGGRISVARSYHGAMEYILRERFDVILLDMSLPSFDVTRVDDGGEFLAFAGREVLRQLRRRTLDARVIVVTQFGTFGKGGDVKTLEELDVELTREYPGRYLGVVQYDEVTGLWPKELAGKLRGLIKTDGLAPR